VKNNYIKSPFNYTGGKYKLLPQVMSLFPDDIKTFYDVFCGGLNVGINAKCKIVCANDKLIQVIDTFRMFRGSDGQHVINMIHRIIEQYGGINFKLDKDSYLKLREDYNNRVSMNRYDEAILFYVLTCHSFSNQIRFNKKGGFNMPYGDRGFNEAMQQNLNSFLNKLHNTTICLSNEDFDTFMSKKFDNMKRDDFVYFDPPYSGTTATYNEGGNWVRQNDIDLFLWADRLNTNDIRFAMSNILNEQYKTAWANKYNVHTLDYNYKNCNYQKKNKTGKKDTEVLITNY